MTTNSFHAWVLAVCPKAPTGAIISVLIGSALAFADGKSDLIPALLRVLSACGMQIIANFINDLHDYLKSSDRTDHLGPERTYAQNRTTPIAMKRGIMGMLVFSCLIGCTLPRQYWGQPPHGGWELILLGLLCVIFIFSYTIVLSYRDWGDLLVLVFFGSIPVGGTYYVQAHVITANVQIASPICGLVIDTLLVVNNYHDHRQDVLNDKHTLIVCFGELSGRYSYLGLGMSTVLLSLWFVYAGKVESLAFIWTPCVYLYLHMPTQRRMATIRNGRRLNSILGETSCNMLFSGLLLNAALMQA